LSASEIAANCKKEIARTRGVVANIAALPTAQRSFATIVVALESALEDIQDSLAVELQLDAITSNEALRLASGRCGDDVKMLSEQTNANPLLAAAIADKRVERGVSKAPDRFLLRRWRKILRTNVADATPARRLLRNRLLRRLLAIEETYRQNFPSPGRFSLDFPEKNARLFREALTVRKRIARIEGYPNWAHDQLDGELAGEPRRVVDFLRRLDRLALTAAKREAALLQRLDPGQAKRGRLNIPTIGTMTRAQRRLFSLPADDFREYFAWPSIETKTFKVLSRVFGLTFTRRPNAELWSSDAEEWAVLDAPSNRYLGELYLDLTRRGKVISGSDAITVELFASRRLANGAWHPPSEIIVAEWLDGRSSLTHDQLVAFFHEMGHAIASLVSRSPYASLTFSDDFVEAPSQLLENWAWDPGLLRTMSARKTDGSHIPASQLKRLIRSRFAFQNLTDTLDVVDSLADIEYNEDPTPAEVDTMYQRLAQSMSPLDIPADFHYEAFKSDLVDTDGSCLAYRYLWSRSYAYEMFAAFQPRPLDDPAVGMRFRRLVLEPGGSDDVKADIAAFLGRPARLDAIDRELTSDPLAGAAPAR
jgi:thimet oligopeptidase